MNIRIATRSVSYSVDVFVEDKGVGTISIMTPRHVAKRVRWMAVEVPSACFIGNCEAKPRCPGPCAKKTIHAGCKSPHEALALMVPEGTDVSDVAFSADFLAGIDREHEAKKKVDKKAKKDSMYSTPEAQEFDTYRQPEPKPKPAKKPKSAKPKGRLSIDTAVKDAEKSLRRHASGD
jgi:hypothetical protein